MRHASAQEIPPTAEPLARTYIDALAHAEGVRMAPMLNPRGGDDDAVVALINEFEGATNSDAPHLRVDLATAAILAVSIRLKRPLVAQGVRRAHALG